MRGVDQTRAASPRRSGREIGGDLPPTILTVFSAMFMHGGLLHIAGNMLFLWIFGNNIEDSMNRAVFVVFYLVGGLAAMLAQTAFDIASAVPTLGASGAIAAVLGGYAVLYPRARVLTLVIIIFFVTILRPPALLVLGFCVLLQFVDFSRAAARGKGGGDPTSRTSAASSSGSPLIRLVATNCTGLRATPPIAGLLT